MIASIRRIVSIVILCVSCFSITAYAEEQYGKVLSFFEDDAEINIYVDPSMESPDIECNIGTKSGVSTEITPISEEQTPMETIILLDNSFSIDEVYRQTIADIMTELCANRMNGECFSIATFSDKANFLIEDSGDYISVKKAIESIRYTDQKTYLTDALYGVIESETIDHLKRIIVISDGVDNENIGYTRDELTALLDSKMIPVYSIGISDGTNNTELENMFAVSRYTGGDYWILNEISDEFEIVNGIAELNDALRISIIPPNEYQDGTKKGVSIKLTEGDRSVNYSIELSMPFAAENENTEDIATKIADNTISIEENEIDGLDPVIIEKENSYILPLVLAAATIIVAVIIIVIIKSRQKKIRSGFYSEPDIEAEENYNNRHTIMIDNAKDSNDDKHHTYLAWSRSITLIDQRDPMKRFRAEMAGGGIIVGYNNGCNIILNYDESVSGEHCRIFEKSGRVEVINLSKTNPTVLNGKQVQGEMPIKTGDVLSLGRLNMKVEIK